MPVIAVEMPRAHDQKVGRMPDVRGVVWLDTLDGLGVAGIL